MARRTAKAAPRSRAVFPTRVALLDACILVRMHKCNALDRLEGALDFVTAEQVHGEFSAGGPSARAALEALDVDKRSIVPGSPEWVQFARVRDAKEFSTVDLGEDQSIALSLAEQQRGRVVPIATDDAAATRKAAQFGVVTGSFLDILVWLIACSRISNTEAEQLEQVAAVRDGWKRPPAYPGPLEPLVAPLCAELTARVEAARTRLPKKRRR